MEAQTLAAILAALTQEADRSGELRRRLSGRLWRMAEDEASGVEPEARAVFASVAAALEGRDAARERQEAAAW